MRYINGEAGINVDGRIEDEKYNITKRQLTRQNITLTAKENEIAAEKGITLQDIGQGTTKSFTQNPERAMKAMELLEYRVRTQEQEIEDKRSLKEYKDPFTSK